MDKKNKPKFTTEDAVLKHISLISINYSCTLGSFDVGIHDLADIGLRVLTKMKKIEEKQ